MNSIQQTLTSQFRIAATAADIAGTRFLDSVVEANRTAVDLAVASAEKLPRIDLPVELPVALPTPADLGGQYVTAVERAVAVQRELGDRFVEMLPADVRPTSDRTAAHV